MAFFIKIIDKSGRFELIDGDFLNLYSHLEINNLIELSESDYQLAYKNPNAKYLAGKFVEERAEIEPMAVLKSMQSRLLEEISTKADKLKNTLLSSYPQTEIESFYRQEKEALAWHADNSVETPMLAQIATARGVPLDILVQNVLKKSDQFAVAIGAIIGQRQKFEDMLLAAETLEQVEQLSKEIEQWSI